MRPTLLALLLLSGPPLFAQEIEPEDLKPGLIARYQDGNAKAASVTRLEHGVAVNLAEDESPHPSLSPNGGFYVWAGHVKILRNGDYAFAARVRGAVQVTIGGKDLFSTASNAENAELKTTDKVPLKAGIQPIRVTYNRPTKGKAVLELMWKVPQFRFEPIPAEQLGHLPKARTPEFQQTSQRDHGRFVFEERGCVQCHAPEATDGTGKSLLVRTGPNLSRIGSRVYPGWLEVWLADPAKLRPETTMPKLFADDDNGKSEAKAIAAYLSTLGGPMPPSNTRYNPQDLARAINRGKALFNSTGCAACHQEKQAHAEVEPSVYGLLTGNKSTYALGAVGSKTRGDRLAEYLQNPHANNPTTRMPNMTLSGEEARDLALYLITARDEKIPQDAGKPTPEQIELGRKLVVSKGCVNCHAIEEQSKSLAKLEAKNLTAIRQSPTAGCLSEKPTNVPLFHLSKTDREAIISMLKSSGPAAKAPTFEARLAFKRFNCLNCHQREGEGGLSAELVEQMQKYEKSENIDDVRPPTLNGVGHKLLTPWFQRVLTGAGRARPWMSLRMPQYGEANVGKLAVGIAHLEGAEVEEKISEVPLTPTKVEVGKLMVGKTGLGCIGCHDIAGIPNTGTRGPDLATTNQRVRYSWYRDWLEQPQRMAPNTRMPQVIIDGKSLFPNALKGDTDAQAEAMWAYLSLGSKLPLPIGLEPPKGLVVKVGKDTEILRTFMPDAGNRAIAVGFPDGVNFVFDANQCRLSYAWAGNFLDASPVWDNRGGAPAKPLGPRFWTAPPGNPWSVGGSLEPPDFKKRAEDPAYGKSMPDLQLFKGVRKVFFEGYSLDEKGSPTFRYHVLSESDSALAVVEKVEPARNSIAAGLSRQFNVSVPAGSACYLHAGDSNREPRLFNAEGTEVPLTLKSGATEQDVAGKLIVLPAEGESSTVLSLSTSLEGAKWRLQPGTGSGWQALVKLPMTRTETKIELVVNVWSVGKIDAAFLKSLAGK